MLKLHLAEYICKDYNIWITLVNKKKTTPRYLFVINWAKERTRPSRIHPWILFNVKPVYYHSLMTKQCYSWPHLCKQFSIERNTNNSCHDKLKILNIQSLAWLNDKTIHTCASKNLTARKFLTGILWQFPSRRQESTSKKCLFIPFRNAYKYFVSQIKDYQFALIKRQEDYHCKGTIFDKN